MGHLAKNSFYSIIISGLRFFSNAVLFIIIARVIGAEEFGRFAFAITFAGIFLVIVDYGFCLQIVKDIAVMPDDVLKLSSDILNAKLLLSLISTVVMVAIINSLNYPTETILIVYILWLSFVFYSFGLFFNSIFRGMNKFQYEAYPTIVLNVIQFILVLLLLYFEFKTFSIALAYLAARTVYFFYSLFLVKKHIGRFTFFFDAKQGVTALKNSLAFGMHTILAALYFQIDTVFLSYFSGDIAVGYYQAAMRIVLASMVIFDIISGSYFPLVARDFRSEKNGHNKILYSFNKYLILTGGSVAVGLFLYADILIESLYGSSYRASTIPLQLLSVVVFLRFAGGAYGAVITVSDNQNMRAMSVGASLVVNILLNCMLIPLYGAEGAAIVSVVTHILMVLLYVLFTYKLLGSCLVSKPCKLGLTVLCAGFIICFILKNISCVSSVVVFITTLITLCVVILDNDEKLFVRQVASRLLP